MLISNFILTCITYYKVVEKNINWDFGQTVSLTSEVAGSQNRNALLFRNTDYAVLKHRFKKLHIRTENILPNYNTFKGIFM